MSKNLQNKTTYDVVLASSSPRRREILHQIGVRFCSVSPDIDESRYSGESSLELVRRLALKKAIAVAELNISDKPILGADTLVTVDNQIFGKPDNKAEFIQMLEKLSGQTHCVLSAVALMHGGQSNVLISQTEVTFRPLVNKEIMDYWETNEPKGKAGGYAIQGFGAVFVDDLKGSYSGVVGLPITQTCHLLTQFGVPLWQSSDA
ncbi:MAG: Maf family protein [Porticoccaceae bacterium]|nr:Maf family protein [Porticoccaceae bacterium]MDG1473993.1 Maf family protein [Porticoccaceae bacterium]